MKRRDILRAAAGAASALFVGACNAAQPKQSTAPVQTRLIDVHTHLFNASDLPTVRFIKIVVLKHYPRQATRVLEIQDPDALDGLIALATWIVGRTRAPSAEEESRVLDGKTRVRAVHTAGRANEEAAIAAIAAFAAQSETAVSGQLSPTAHRRIRSALFAAAGVDGAAVRDGPMEDADAKLLAERAFRSKDLGLVLRWFALFTRYRHSLAEELASTHAQQGFPPQLLCPAAIDYDLWLRENVDESPLPAQVAVMGRLARRTTGPVIHGYIGFDPLRQAYYAAGRFKAYDPLALVRHAVRDEGFLGVKLYPPMGFRAIGNEAAVCQTYREEIVSELAGGASDDPQTAACKPRPADGSRAIGRMLDHAMTALFDLCATEDACILAHANNSNASADGYGARADPAYWVAVFQRWPQLRIGLAHFGEFAHVSSGAGSQLPEASWEWALGRYFKEARDAPVFADVSYLTEIAGKNAQEMAAYTKLTRRWVDEFDPQCRHLMFGTDWTMLGLDASYEGYTRRVYDFFRDGCGFDQTRLDRLFSGNAAHFLGLRKGDTVRARLLKFYRLHNIPTSRLPLITET